MAAAVLALSRFKDRNRDAHGPVPFAGFQQFEQQRAFGKVYPAALQFAYQASHLAKARKDVIGDVCADGQSRQCHHAATNPARFIAIDRHITSFALRVTV